MKLLNKSRNHIAIIGAICAVSLLTAETANMRKSDRLRNVTRLSNCSAPGHPEVLDTEEENTKQPPTELTPSNKENTSKTEDNKKEGA